MSFFFLNSQFGLGPRTAAVSAICVARKFNNVGFLEAKDVLESMTDGLQDLERLVCRAGLVALAHRSCPQTNTVESLTHVHDNTHNFVITIVLKSLANSGQLGM